MAQILTLKAQSPDWIAMGQLRSYGAGFEMLLKIGYGYALKTVWDVLLAGSHVCLISFHDTIVRVASGRVGILGSCIEQTTCD